MASAILPIDHKGLTCRDAANLFRGLAELLDVYPAEGVVVTLHVDVAATGTPTSARKKTAARR